MDNRRDTSRLHQQTCIAIAQSTATLLVAALIIPSNNQEVTRLVVDHSNRITEGLLRQRLCILRKQMKRRDAMATDYDIPDTKSLCNYMKAKNLTEEYGTVRLPIDPNHYQ